MGHLGPKNPQVLAALDALKEAHRNIATAIKLLGEPITEADLKGAIEKCASVAESAEEAQDFLEFHNRPLFFRSN